MIRPLFLFVVFLFATVGALSAQTYKQLIRQADSLYRAKDYKKSLGVYQQAIKLDAKNYNDLYNAACAAALAGDKTNALKFLSASIDNGWTNISHMKQDSDLNALHDDKRWAALVNELQKKVDAIEARYDKPLQNTLLEVLKSDQDIRQVFMKASKEFGYTHPKVDSLGRVMNAIDSVNLIRVRQILDERGWVGEEIVGPRANQALFLVVQHADLATQEQYLPMMRDAVKKGTAKGDALALLEDRVALRKGDKQIYGSQIYRDQNKNVFYVAPLLDPDNVDKRRASVGLEPISDYVQQWQIVWDVVQYKKNLPEYEQLLNARTKAK
ncbi:DUF6624 domain-containing protein [Pseudochryseolinea flava]|uniref:DUF6624 domain-containing protein n=1 Tax=Pseudochryseolinea flava TaxID=2059302 RepID=UPI001629E7AA|nr:DUF6624 domain-containing protein [Pseudochryseolinea flava]